MSATPGFYHALSSGRRYAINSLSEDGGDRFPIVRGSPCYITRESCQGAFSSGGELASAAIGAGLRRNGLFAYADTQQAGAQPSADFDDGSGGAERAHSALHMSRQPMMRLGREDVEMGDVSLGGPCRLREGEIMVDS